METQEILFLRKLYDNVGMILKVYNCDFKHHWVRKRVPSFILRQKTIILKFALKLGDRILEELSM